MAIDLPNNTRESNTRFFSRYILHHKRSYSLGIVLIFLTNWLAVSIPAYLGKSIDLLSGVEKAQNQDELMLVIGTVIAFALAMHGSHPHDIQNIIF